MSDETPRLKLAQLVSLQELNAVTWNEALAQLDALVDLCLLGQFVNTPPSSPQDGDAYLTGGAPTGAWSGYAYKIAACRDGAWRFYAPFNGLRAFVTATGNFIAYLNGQWSDWNALVSAAETALASAATCDLGAAGSLLVQITGAAAITSFGSGANKLRFVRFAQSLTLTHNAVSLILLGGTSRTTAAGDVGIYASDGSGNWRERAYFRAAADPGKPPVTLDGAGRLLLPNQPVFTAYLNTITGNVCGDGNDHTIVFNATTINRSTVYNTANGKFTAPVAGNYLFTGSALATSIGASNTVGWLMLRVGYAAGGALNVYSNGMNPYVCMRSDGYVGMILGSPVLPLSAGDTVEFQIHINGSSNSVGLYGGGLGSGLNTFFSGFLLAA
jgi:hypothetical protein